ncbi:phosphate ABC transporter permease [Aeromonas diversa CDC 2478-85]|uniref:Phosphate ABC transporter permease n=1 Tax=Aeromonas diversa CDC 2478-85 TaxID=1268237 RepID=N9V4S8_9GAMM|nr:ABC transporter permease subunit [Aeromonas diversa]ENY70332.1 phosphate ABC transporter permease [Aeromonas diversa CDC 2478-85]
MSSETIALAMAGSRKRRVKDKLAKYSVTVGGSLVLVALLLIFFYLLYVVKPIFHGASMEASGAISLPAKGKTVWLGSEEQNEIGFRFGDGGQVSFFALQGKNGFKGGQIISQQQIELPISSVTRSHGDEEVIVYGLQDGRVLPLRPAFAVSYPNDTRVIAPELKYPFGEEPMVVDPERKALTKVAFEANSSKVVVAALTEDGRGVMSVLSGEQNFLTGETEWGNSNYTIPALPRNVDQMLMTPNQRYLFLRDGNRLSVYDIRNPAEITLRNVLEVNAKGGMVTKVALLSGASSLLVANDNGVISQWFEVARDGQREFAHIRDFAAAGPVNDMAMETHRKGFAATTDKGTVDIFHTTGETRLLSEKMETTELNGVALSPRNNLLMVEKGNEVRVFTVENEHPEVTWSALWQEVWYEGYPEPQFVWQSTSASNDFEPKLSLVPLAFGTLKASLYAMLFAVPLGVAGAIYTAYFMSAGLRKVVKPTVEIMAALPTVILGFLAGLWLAPLVEDHLPGIVLLLVLLPAGMLASALAWHYLPERLRLWVPEGWQAILLVPVLLLIGWGAFALSPVIENLFFHGDTRIWLTNDMGMKFDQRNALVVGIAMGFAVIPTIFSIAEDAVFSVPKHLTQGSLALGATPWQTLSRVVILTASPGIFSAVMMGLGRAVGETMIVLMATGNTPIMDFSMFQGLRTLAANIAVEMPESEVGSSHYRVLFLAAFVLFVFTFVFNTLAEFIRQRLREKYSSL